jgi:hypothetical protein
MPMTAFSITSTHYSLSQIFLTSDGFRRVKTGHPGQSRCADKNGRRGFGAALARKSSRKCGLIAKRPQLHRTASPIPAPALQVPGNISCSAAATRE